MSFDWRVKHATSKTRKSKNNCRQTTSSGPCTNNDENDENAEVLILRAEKKKSARLRLCYRERKSKFKPHA
jgi:hypothetical protein